ncbi:MAG: hypothetical protein MUE79_04950 [Nitratireductor sp.]|nr:hypothetical protein [Nitratireductor sp.]
MEQIEQLRAMRDAAKARLEATPDHRLMTSLTALIEDLESAFGGPKDSGPAAEQESAPQESAGSSESEPAESDGETAFAHQAAPEQAGDVAEEEAPEETVVVMEQVEEIEEIDPGQIDFDQIDLDISPQEIDADDLETVIAAEVLSMNGDAMAGSLSESAEDAVNRALDELSMDLADTLAAEPATNYKR